MVATNKKATADVSVSKIGTKMVKMSRNSARNDADTSTTDLVRQETTGVSSSQYKVEQQATAKKLEYAGEPGPWKEKKLQRFFGNLCHRYCQRI